MLNELLYFVNDRLEGYLRQPGGERNSQNTYKELQRLQSKQE